MNITTTFMEASAPSHHSLINNSEVEITVASNGHQYFGYAGEFATNVISPVNGIYYIYLIDSQQQRVLFQVDEVVYKNMCARNEQISTNHAEHTYLWLEKNSLGKITNWRLFKSTLDLAKIYPIYQANYNFESLYQLFYLIESLKTVPLRVFARMILEDAFLMQRFVSIPASKHHHHSFPGGLLTHSIECALITKQNLEGVPDMSVLEQEITIMAALLHDIGKTQTLGRYQHTSQHTSIGKLLDHEQLTLIVLANPLNKLTQYWEKGAETLQYLLMWSPKKGFCKYIGGNVIKLADQLSTSISLRRMAFKNKPDYHHFAYLQTGYHRQCVNRLPSIL